MLDINIFPKNSRASKISYSKILFTHYRPMLSSNILESYLRFLELTTSFIFHYLVLYVRFLIFNYSRALYSLWTNLFTATLSKATPYSEDLYVDRVFLPILIVITDSTIIKFNYLLVPKKSAISLSNIFF